MQGNSGYQGIRAEQTRFREDFRSNSSSQHRREEQPHPLRNCQYPGQRRDERAVPRSNHSTERRGDYLNARDNGRAIEDHRSPRAAPPERISAHDRLGPRVNPPHEELDSVQTTLSIVDGIRDLSAETREYVLKYAFKERARARREREED